MLHITRRLLTTHTGADLVYRSLLRHDVRDVFMYSGGAIMGVIDKFDGKNIRYYVNNHEQNCGHAATGYAKASGRPGVAIVTSGPGLTNCITPLLDATNDSTPFILISGQVPKSAVGTNAFQECPAVDLTRPVTKWSIQVQEAETIPEIMDRAFRIATTGKPGSVHIDLPKCVINSLVSNPIEPEIVPNKSINFLSNNTLARLAYIINASNRPILYVGQGCNTVSRLLTDLVDRMDIPVTTTLHAVGCLDEKHSCNLKFLGMHGSPAANYAMQEADLIIAIGSRFDDRTTGNLKKFAPKAQNIIHVNINGQELNKIVKSTPERRVHAVECDAGFFLYKILPYLKSTSRSAWWNQLDSWKQQHSFRYHTPLDGRLSTQMVIEAIDKYLLKRNIRDAIITSGVGNHQMMCAQFMTWRQPRSFLTSGSLGVMGAGLPYAIGAKLAMPNRLVLDIDGDGSFNHTLADLQTVDRYKIPIKIAIMNDGQQSMVRAWEKLFYKENYVATGLPSNPTYAELANSYRIDAYTCDHVNDLEAAIELMMETPHAVLVDFKTESDLCLPLVSPGAALDDMILFDKYHDNLHLVGQAPN